VVNEVMIQEHWKNWKEHRNPEAGDLLVQEYLPLVNYVVQHYVSKVPSTVQKDELVSYAYDGLLDAIEKYDENREIKFETYATWRIKGAIIDALRSNDHISRTLRSKVKKIEQAYEILEQQKQRNITVDEVCNYLHIDRDEVDKTMQLYREASVSSIDEETTDNDNLPTSLVSIIEDRNIKTPSENLSEKEMKKMLADTIVKLPEKEKLVVSLYYFEELKFNEIAEVLNVSVPRISQLHSKALKRLQEVLLNIDDFTLEGI
jgi:RNA polymerase sigma factor FliA